MGIPLGRPPNFHKRISYPPLSPLFLALGDLALGDVGKSVKLFSILALGDVGKSVKLFSNILNL